MGASEAILHRIGEARMSFHLADACPADTFATFRAEHPDHIAVSYINCSAAVKALSDLICTSSNAVDLVKQLPAGGRSSNESKI